MRKCPLIFIRAKGNGTGLKDDPSGISERFENFRRETNQRIENIRGSFRHGGEKKPDRSMEYVPFQKEKWHTLSHPLKSESVSLRSIPIDDSKLSQGEQDHDSAGNDGEKRVHTRPKPSNQSKVTESPWKLQSFARKAQTQDLCEDILWDNVILKNPFSKVANHLKTLRNEKFFRMKKKKIVFHGYKIIMDLAKNQKIYPNLVIHRKFSHSGSHRHDKMIEALKKEIQQHSKEAFFVQATKSVMEEIDSGNDGFIAEYSMPEYSPKELLFASPNQFKSILVLDNVTDGGSLGTFMRTAVSFGYELVILVNNCIDAFDPSVLRAARGAHFQQSTNFVVLSDANGDDETELLNRTLEHHNALPFIYSPKQTLDQNIECISLEDAQQSIVDHTRRIASRAPEKSMQNDETVFKSRFHRVGRAIFASEDKTCSFVPKLASRLRTTPRRLYIGGQNAEASAEKSVHDPQAKLLEKPRDKPTLPFCYDPIETALPIILYSMQSDDICSVPGQSDEAENAINDQNTYTQYKVDIRDNIVGEENLRGHFNEISKSRYENRMLRYQMTDEERWEAFEMQKIKEGHKNFRRFMTDIFDDHTPRIMEGADPYPTDAATSEAGQKCSIYPDLFQDKQKLMKPSRDSIRQHAQHQDQRILPSKYRR